MEILPWRLPSFVQAEVPSDRDAIAINSPVVGSSNAIGTIPRTLAASLFRSNSLTTGKLLHAFSSAYLDLLVCDLTERFSLAPPQPHLHTLVLRVSQNGLKY
ncbi:hypothetical protein E4T56_gene185 [Termitomyces sp. T112]|nr:hypothetical protein E4T56_gene185 [Termitomyces sp. T112]